MNLLAQSAHLPQVRRNVVQRELGLMRKCERLSGLRRLTYPYGSSLNAVDTEEEIDEAPDKGERNTRPTHTTAERTSSFVRMM